MEEEAADLVSRLKARLDTMNSPTEPCFFSDNYRKVFYG